MSDSETSDEDFRPGDKEESEDDSECEEEEEEEEVADVASAVEHKRASRRGAKTEETDVKKDELESDEEDKSRTDALWKDFLSDVKPQTSNKSVIKTTTTTTSDSEKKDNSNAKLKTDSKEEPVKKVSSPINLLKLNEEKISNGKRESLTKIQSPIPTKVKRPLGAGGLSAVLSITQKKQKKSILDSSLEDWKSFKEDEGLQEELKEYNKGKDGYLDRQDFLKRTDYRQFEIEKNLRRTRYK